METLKTLAMMMKPKPIMYATIKGSLTDNNGVFSGFSSSNYLALQQPFILNADTIAEIVVKVNIPTLKTSNAFFATDISRGIYINITGTGLIQLYIGNGTDWVINQLNGTHSLNANTDYYIKINFNNNVVTISISTDNANWIQDIQTNMNLDTTTNYIIKLGVRSSTQYFNGSIDFKQSYIKINNTKYQLQAVVGYTVVGSPTINNGVASGFSSSNYLQVYQSSGNVDSIEIVTKIDNIAETISSINLIVGSTGNLAFHLIISTNKRFSFNYKDINTTTRYISPTSTATNGYIKIIMKQDGCKLYHSTDNITWNILGSNSNKPYLTNAFTAIRFGYLSTTYNVFTGDLYIKDTSIKINNRLWFNGQPA